MPHDVRSPHIFQDGPGNTASGEQVMDNFDALWTKADATIAGSQLTAATVALTRLVPLVLYGMVIGGTGAIGTAGSGGWTSSRSGAGAYTVTFSPAFSAGPVAIATANTGSVVVAHIPTLGVGSIDVTTRTTTTGANIDANFTFIVIGIR